MGITIMSVLHVTFFLFPIILHSVSGSCFIEPPVNHDSPQIGLIFIPGATIPGDAYLPLMRAVQYHYPGSLWIGATTEWSGDFPNPLEIGSQISECTDNAERLGLDTSLVFHAGHMVTQPPGEEWRSARQQLPSASVDCYW